MSTVGQVEDDVVVGGADVVAEVDVPAEVWLAIKSNEKLKETKPLRIPITIVILDKVICWRYTWRLIRGCG